MTEQISNPKEEKQELAKQATFQAYHLNPPNQTLYINNLNERVHIEDLKQTLQNIFWKFGTIKQIVAKRNIRMRGQAFIVFDSQESATQSIKELQNYVMFGKPMNLNYAKEVSDIFAKEQGNYVQREKKLKGKLEPPNKQPEKKVKLDSSNGESKDKNATTSQQPKLTKSQVVPNNILFVESLPKDSTQELIAPFFQQYLGFREIRLIASKCVAFVEYGDEFQAGVALQGLNGTNVLPDCPMSISYAKK